MKAILDLPEPHTKALAFLMEKVPPAENLWTVTGSAGLRLQGVDLSVHDLDLQADITTVYVLAENLAEFMRTPLQVWETEHTRSYHGQAEIHGLQVELLDDVRHRSSAGRWEPPLDISSVLVWVNWRGLKVPVLSLAHEAQAYEKMERTQKAELIRSTISKVNS